jgi:hypothetical protein
MQQFVVPQFIDVEDKIFGPITTRQFLILLVTAGFLFVAFKLFDLALFALVTAVLGGGALILAFAKINGQSFHYFLLNIGQTAKKPGLRIWSKELSTEELNYLIKLGINPEVEVKEQKKVVERNHIRDLSLLVNTGGFYRPDDEL